MPKALRRLNRLGKGEFRLLGTIISLFGSDCVGKTTHARLLILRLVRKGYKVKGVWIKNNHTVAYLVILMLKSISKRSVVVLPSNAILTNVLAQSRLGKKLWLWIDFIGVVVKLIFSVYMFKLLGHVIVADRYLPDTIVSMVVTLNDPKVMKSLPIKFIVSRIMRDRTNLVMLDRSYELIKNSRKNNWVEPPSLICYQRMLYRTIAKITNAPIVSTDRSVSEVHRNILSLITLR